MQPRILKPNEIEDRAERLAESLTGMLIDHTTRPGMYTAGFRQRADTVLSILDEIGRAYSEHAFVDNKAYSGGIDRRIPDTRLPVLGTLAGCAHYFEGRGRYDNSVVFFRGSRHHDGDVTNRFNSYRRYAWEDDHVQSVSMQPGQDFLDEKARQFADEKGLKLTKFGSVSVMRSKEIGEGGDEIILTRWAATESPEKYRHFAAGVVSSPFSGPQALIRELTRALDVSEVALIPAR